MHGFTSANQLKERWWETRKGEAHKLVIDAIKWVDEHQDYHRERVLHNHRLYEGSAILGLDGGDYNRRDALDDRLQINVIQSVVETAVAQIGTVRPVPTPITFDGDFDKQQKAKKLRKFINGAFSMAKAYRKGTEIFRDGAIQGCGHAKIYEEDGEIRVERVLPGEIVVDEEDARGGEPRSIFQVKNVAREVLVDKFPKHKQAIIAANRIRTPLTQDSTLSRAVDVCEAWHLPSSEGAKDGRHVICIDGQDLIDEPWEDDWFPFSKFTWQKGSYGYFGRGLSDILSTIQQEIDFLSRRIQEIINLNVPRLMAPTGANVSVQKLTNEVMTVLRGDGLQIFNPNAVPSEYFAERERLYQKAFEISGINQIGAFAQKPTDASGRAIRLMMDIQSRRFLHIQQDYEDFYIDIAKKTIALARKIDERGDGSVKIMAADKDHLEYIEWGDVRMEDDEFVMRIMPTNIVDQIPGARLETARELLEAIPELRPHALKMLSGHPDIEAIAGTETASTDIVDQMIDHMIDEGEYIPPEPFMDLQFALKHTQNTYLKLKMRGVPDERLQLLRDFMADIKDMVDGAQQAAMAQQAAAQPQATPPQAALPLPAGGGGPQALPPEAALPLAG